MKRRKFIKNAGLSIPGMYFGSSLLANTLNPLMYSTQDVKNRIKLTISQVEVEIAKGLIIKTFGYNGSSPGPVLKMKDGELTEVEVINKTDHDEVMHWHGQEIPAEVDGSEEEGTPLAKSHSSQKYVFKPGPPGLKWYHTHMLTDGDKRFGMYSGQQGIVFVEPKHNLGNYDQEVSLIAHEWQYLLEHSLNIPLDDLDAKVYTLNGKTLDFNSPIKVKEGKTLMLRIINGCARDTIKFACSGHKMKIVSMDGKPVPNPNYVREIKLGSGERASMLIKMDNPGKWVFGDTDDTRRKGGLGIKIEYPNKTGEAKWEIDDYGNKWDYGLFADGKKKTKPENEIDVVVKRYETDDGTLYKVNGKPFEEQEEPIELKYGENYRINFYNSNIKDHPFHLHRHYLELVNHSGKEMSGLMKDTIFLDPHEFASVDIKANQKGLSLFHCHKQNHMEEGFMALFNCIE